MLYVTLQGMDMKYDLENLIYTFYPKNEVVFIPENSDEALDINEERIDVLSVLIKEDCNAIMYMTAAGFQVDPSEEIPWVTASGEVPAMMSSHETLKTLKQELKLAVYDLLKTHKKSSSPWGILVGVRPVKLVHEMLDQGLSPELVGLKLRDSYRVSDEKIELALQIAEVERPYLEDAQNVPLSLYICIPFCPTRCLYCSFPSNAMGQKGYLMTSYLEALHKEIVEVSKMIQESGRTVDCIYIGGGTPTSLDSNQLRVLLDVINKNVGTEHLLEYTVEAGRPDSISKEKLEIMHMYGVDRICINPQTMNDETLSLIGRDHKSQEVTRVYKMAKEIGFKTVNMDLIVGLPGEQSASIEKTMNILEKLEPENVTLHTLSIKRSSKLNANLDEYVLTEKDTVENMMDLAMGRLYDGGLIPYYMYRQKKILANLENVGFSKPNHESVYNIRIMEERHPIIALGAGAVSKMVYIKENRFERVANTKGVEDYINRIDEMIGKKKPYLTVGKKMI